jgi:hypothetical protein
MAVPFQLMIFREVVHENDLLPSSSSLLETGKKDANPSLRSAMREKGGHISRKALMPAGPMIPGKRKENEIPDAT